MLASLALCVGFEIVQTVNSFTFRVTVGKNFLFGLIVFLR